MSVVVDIIFLGRPCFICGRAADVVLVQGTTHTFRCMQHIPDYIPKEIVDGARDAQMRSETETGVIGKGEN